MLCVGAAPGGAAVDRIGGCTKIGLPGLSPRLWDEELELGERKTVTVPGVTDGIWTKVG